MFKCPMSNREANEQAARFIERKITEKVSALIDPEQSNSEFIGNLFDLCILNKMAESHVVSRD